MNNVGSAKDNPKYLRVSNNCKGGTVLYKMLMMHRLFSAILRITLRSTLTERSLLATPPRMSERSSKTPGHISNAPMTRTNLVLTSLA